MPVPCRTMTPFSFGGMLNGLAANCWGNRRYGTHKDGPCLKRPSVVASYQANAFGLYDMHGNNGHWCIDWYDETTTRLSNKRPIRPQSGLASCDPGWQLVLRPRRLPLGISIAQLARIPHLRTGVPSSPGCFAIARVFQPRHLLGVSEVRGPKRPSTLPLILVAYA